MAWTGVDLAPNPSKGLNPFLSVNEQRNSENLDRPLHPPQGKGRVTKRSKCTVCGAPQQAKKCEYCGTELG